MVYVPKALVLFILHPLLDSERLVGETLFHSPVGALYPRPTTAPGTQKHLPVEYLLTLSCTMLWEAKIVP